jgi:hypothetical protein
MSYLFFPFYGVVGLRETTIGQLCIVQKVSCIPIDTVTLPPQLPPPPTAPFLQIMYMPSQESIIFSVSQTTRLALYLSNFRPSSCILFG